jgi:autotransporter-associated beta strand protein
MNRRSIGLIRLTIGFGALGFATALPALAQTRSLGLDISAWQGNISQATWNNIYNVENRDFVFLRSSRGGTTGYYDQSNADNNPPTNTLSQRYDDPYFIQNITRATTAGMYAGSYHFGRMDIIASTLNSGGIPNNGTDEANHFIEMAGPWMRPGYLLPVFDFEAGNGARTASELAQFAIDFSDRIYAVNGIRPAVYIGNNYSAPMNNIPESAEVAAAYPTLWNARWPNQSNPDSIPVQTADPGDYTSTIYGPWDNPPNPADPWHFWQYASTGRLQSYNNGGSNLDFDVAKGGIEYLKDHLVPALWTQSTSGDWSTLTNWNSGQTPVAPVQGPGQVPRVGPLTLPTPRLPGAAGSGVIDGHNDTVILDRPNEDVTVTLSAGAHNIRKLFAREALNITGGSLNINYVPSWDSTTNGAAFSAPVSLSGAASLSVHTLQVDPLNSFTLGGGTLTFDTINLMPSGLSPARINVTGDVALNPLSNAAAKIAPAAGSGSSGFLDLGGAARVFNIGNGTSADDLTINVPISNGALTKSGPGTLALSGTNTYTGNTSVEQGKLRLTSATLADASAVYLAAGATLELSYTGAPDVVHDLYLNGVPQTNGYWGAVGSGAQFTSSQITGTGWLHVTPNPPLPPPPPPPGDVLDDFEVNEGHFGTVYNYSPVSQTFGLDAATTIDRVTTEQQGETGFASQLLNLVIDADAPDTWQLRHNSGIGAIANPAGNTPIVPTGYVGFWLKTDEAGVSVRLGIDDPVAGNTALELGFSQNVIPDNQWHLYQWNLEDANHWNAFAGGANGEIDGEGGDVTIDSIWFNGTGSSQIYLDNVSHNPNGQLRAAGIHGDYNGDGDVNSADYMFWRVSFGNIVTPGTKADGNGNGVIDSGDYVFWRTRIALGGGPGASAANALTAVPEPAGFCLAIAAIVAAALSRHRIP